MLLQGDAAEALGRLATMRKVEGCAEPLLIRGDACPHAMASANPEYPVGRNFPRGVFCVSE